MTSLWFDTALTPAGWARGVRLMIEGGLIAGVETGATPLAGDERGAIAVPGLCNVHSHGFQRGMAGLTEYRGGGEDDFWSWRELMYRFLDRLTPDDVQAITAKAYAEMLEGGFTRVGEFHYLHHDPAGRPYADPAEMAGRIATAAAATGVGLTLLPVYYAQGGFGGTPPTAGQRRFLNDPGRFARLMEESGRAIAGLPDARLGVAPHSLRAVGPADLRAIVPLAGPGGVHIHAAEQTKEVDDCLAWSGRRPVEWLLDEVGLDARWRLIHATHLMEIEVERLARSGAVAGLCPITEANLGDGIFPAEGYLAAGGRMAVGTDSNVLIDAAQELRALEYSQRLTRRARNVLASAGPPSTGANLFDRALAGGAQALGEPITGLATGGSADIVSLDPEHPALVGRAGDALLDGWIFAGGARCVGTVWRRGERVVERGRHRHVAAIDRAYAATLRRLLGVKPQGLASRIRADVEARIRSGDWPPGHRLPTEHELVAEYGCARMTVSKAMGALAAGGLIERRNRAGSFVARPQVHAAVLEIPDLQAVIEARGETYAYKGLARATRRLDPADPDEAALGARGEALALEGLHVAQGAPFALERRVIVLAAAPEAAAVDFGAAPPGSWLLRQTPWTEAEHRIAAVNPNLAEARRLAVDRSAACLQVKRWTWRQGLGVTFVVQLFPGGAYDLVARFGPERR